MKYILILACSIYLYLFTSCELVRGNYYNKINSSQREQIKEYNDTIKIEHGYIYEITGEQLLDKLANESTSLVYIFKNFCIGDNCLPLTNVIDYASTNKLSLFLVMSSYYKINLTTQQNINYPIYSINAKNYGNPNKDGYIEKFKEDIGCYKYMEINNLKKWVGNYIFYENDSIIEIKKKLMQ